MSSTLGVPTSVLSGLGAAMSAACRNAVRSSPTSMNAACMPGSTRCTRPLYRLLTMPRRLCRSTNSSVSTPFSMSAARFSRGATLIRISVVTPSPSINPGSFPAHTGMPACRSRCAVSNSGRPMTPVYVPEIPVTKTAPSPWIAYAPALPAARRSPSRRGSPRATAARTTPAIGMREQLMLARPERDAGVHRVLAAGQLAEHVRARRLRIPACRESRRRPPPWCRRPAPAGRCAAPRRPRPSRAPVAARIHRAARRAAASRRCRPA